MTEWHTLNCRGRCSAQCFTALLYGDWLDRRICTAGGSYYQCEVEADALILAHVL